MIRASLTAATLLPAVASLLVTVLVGRAAALEARWSPPSPGPGDVVTLTLRGAPEGTRLSVTLAGRSYRLFTLGGEQLALVGIDVDQVPGLHRWVVNADGRAAPVVEGALEVRRREYAVQHLTLPPTMVDLAPEVERRATAEAERLRSVYATVTPERLWRGRFVRPVGGVEPGTGFGARRVINGKPRAPHTGIDYAAPTGTPVMATNAGRVALVGEFFFPGRLVVLDHGLGVYSLYFHLEQIGVTEGQHVGGGQPIGTVGATGRATGPHLHFGVHASGARIDPATLLELPLPD